MATASSAATGCTSATTRAASSTCCDTASPGQAYNLPGGNERTNREVVKQVLDQLGKPWSLVRTVEDRSGHDRRYAMDGALLASLGWEPEVPMEVGLATAVEWYRANEPWWRAARSGTWQGYYERQYASRLANSTNA